MQEKQVFITSENFTEHLPEIKKILRGVSSKKKDTNSSFIFDIRSSSSGPIDYRLSPDGRKYDTICTQRFLVQEIMDTEDKRPVFFLRTVSGQAPEIVIECISQQRNLFWNKNLKENSEYFSEGKRYFNNGLPGVCLDRIFFQASDDAYFRFRIKRKNLNSEQFAELKVLFDHFFSLTHVSPGKHDTNTYSVENLKNVVKRLTEPKVLKKKIA